MHMLFLQARLVLTDDVQESILDPQGMQIIRNMMSAV
jgi:hypothetical protein